MSIINSDDGAGAVKVQVQSAIARILQKAWHNQTYGVPGPRCEGSGMRIRAVVPAQLEL